MSAKAQTLAGTLTALFPQLSGPAAKRLAEEVERIVDKGAEGGWDLTMVTLLAKGARRNEIGTALKDLRIRAGLTQEEVTRRTTRLTRKDPWHGSKLSRIESGRVPITFGDLAFLLQMYGVTNPATVDALWELAQTSRSIQQARKAS